MLAVTPHPVCCHLSGCRESNSDLTHPMGRYYHYTTARYDSFGMFGESVTHQFLLKLCSTPPRPVGLRLSIPGKKQYLLLLRNPSRSFGVPGIEPGSHEPESCILPLYYTPLGFNTVYSSISVCLRLIFPYLRLWFSGRTRPCQGRDSGSIPGSRTRGVNIGITAPIAQRIEYLSSEQGMWVRFLLGAQKTWAKRQYSQSAPPSPAGYGCLCGRL